MTISIVRNTESVDTVPQLVFEIDTQHRVCVALLTALVYHSITTIDKDVRYIWPNPRNSVSLIYFANRYIGLLGAIFSFVLSGLEENSLLCKVSYWTSNLSNIFTIVLTDYILLIRVSALYHQSKMLDICLKILLLSETVVVLGMLISDSFVEAPTAGSLAEGVTICVMAKVSDTFFIISWSMPLAYGLLLLILALYKAAEYWRLSYGFQGFYLVRVLVEDQVMYYGFVIFCCVLNMIFIRINVYTLIAANLVVSVSSPTLLCILGGRLLIDMKEAGERGANPGTSFQMKSLSEMEFS